MSMGPITSLGKCEKCGKTAMGYIHTVLVCGGCMIKWNKKQIEKNIEGKRMILEDIE